MLKLCSDCVCIAACVSASRVMKVFAKSAVRYVLMVLVMTQLCGYGAYAQGGPARVDHAARPGEFIVMLHPNADADSLVQNSRLQGLQLRKGRPLSRHLNIWLMHYTPAPNRASEELATIISHPDVHKAQFNHYVTLRAVPNDPRFGEQWALDNTGQSGGTPELDIGAVEAWDIAEGGLSAHGDEIVIAVIDDGFDLDHEDLIWNFWKNEKDPIGDDNAVCEGTINPLTKAPYHDEDDDCNGYIDDYHGWNAYYGIGDIPIRSHGTHVAGIAAARGNTLGVSGVNRNTRVVPIVGYSGGISEADVVSAYNYALTLRKRYNATDGAEGAYIVATNSSFGIAFGHPDYYWAWCYMYERMGEEAGILSVGAADLFDHDADVENGIPDSCDSEYLIMVTSTDHNDMKDFDDDGFGPDLGAAWGATRIDLGAPGKDILSTLPGDVYGNKSGPSMAAPHVAGAIALMYAAAPPSVVDKFDPSWTALQFKSVLLANVDPIADLAKDGTHPTVTGGRLNVLQALEALVDTDIDGVVDSMDNCLDANYPNPGQDDTDADGCGNLCDADYDNNGIVGFPDFGQFVAAFGTGDMEKCHNEPISGCVVGFPDFGSFVAMFGSPPGPSGTTACP